MARKTHLEGGLLVEMTNGDIRCLPVSPFDGVVRHMDAGIAFGDCEFTPEDEFRANMRRVVSRSRFDSR